MTGQSGAHPRGTASAADGETGLDAVVALSGVNVTYLSE
jgi:hypothetical protein